MPWSIWKLLWFACGAMAYIVAGTIGVELVSLPPGNLTLIWLPSGIGILLVHFFGGRRGVPLVLACSVLVNFLPLVARPDVASGQALLSAVMTGLFDAAQSWLGASLWRRLAAQQGPRLFYRPEDMLRFFLWVCLLPPLLTCGLLVITPALCGVGPALSGLEWLGRFSMVALADIAGIFIMVPLFRLGDLWHQAAGRWLELAGWLLLMSLPVAGSLFGPASIILLSFPVMLLIGVRFGIAGSALAAVWMGGVMVAATANGLGLFHEMQREVSFVSLILGLLTTHLTLHIATLMYSELREHRDALDLQVKARTAELAQANARLKELAERDELTGVSNRRCWINEGRLAFEHSLESGHPLSVLILDLDHFKLVNDNWGHLAGDEVLRTFCQRLQDLLRSTDQVGRWGGEEFAVLLPDTDLEQASFVAEKLRGGIAATRFKLSNGVVLDITASIGVTCRLERDRFIDDLFMRADAALYEGKRGGRNRVVCT